MAMLEAVLTRARTTRHPWLSACDANMCPEDFEKSLWFQREQMHVVAPKEASTCERIERIYDYVIASGSLKGKSSQMEVVEDFESRPHQAVSFVVRREQERKERCERKLPKVLPGCSGGKLPGRSTKEKGREEGEVDEDGEERRIRDQIVQGVVAGIEVKVSGHEGNKEAIQTPAGQSFMRSWDCLQTEKYEEEESWREGDQMAVHWDEEQKLEEIWERRRIEGSSLKLEVMQKVPELVVHERMSQGKGVKGLEEKKRVY